MAEAVGLAASIIAILELSAKVGKLCVQYSTAAGSARTDITRLQSRLKDLDVCLEAAQRLINDPKNTALATSRSLVDSLNACEAELAKVQERLIPGSARKAMRRFGLRALKWPFGSKEISTVVSNVEHYKQTITLCLQVDQTTILLDMTQRVEGLSLQQQSTTSVACPPCFNVPFDRDYDFVARPDMTAWLRDKYSGSTGRMALVGMGGFGKSQVAINFAYCIHDENSNVNIFWVHASSRPRFEEAYRAIAERMKLPKRDDPSTDILALVRDWLKSDESGSWLVILDNADDVNLFYPKGTDVRPLASLLPRAPHGAILVTSRSLDVAERLTGSHKNIFKVSTMDETQGLHLITNKLTGEFEHDAAVQLLRVLEYIPLAITQAAAYINRRSPRESVESYLEAFLESDQKRNSLLEVDLGDLRRDETVSNSVITTWKVTFEKIRHESPSAADLLSFMSLFDHKGIPEFALHYYNGKPTHLQGKAACFEDDLDVLRSYSLVYITANRDVFELHATVQACTRVWTSSSDKLPELRNLFMYSMRDNFKRSKFKNWPRCQMLLPHLESVIREEPQTDDVELWAMLLHQRQHKTEDAEMIDIQLVETSKRIWGEEHELTLNSMNDLALNYIHQLRDAEAEELLVRTLKISQRIQGDRHPDVLKTKGNLVLTYLNQNQYDKAEEIGTEVVEGCKKVLGSEHPDTLLSMNILAWTYLEQGELGKAIDLQKKVLVGRKRVLGERHPRTLGTMTLGAKILKIMGQHKNALSLMQTCANLYRERELALTMSPNLAGHKSGTLTSDMDKDPAHSTAPQTTGHSQQSYNNVPYQNQQQGYEQPPYPGQNPQTSDYQSYSVQSQQSHSGQQYSGHQAHSLQPQPPPYNTYQPPQQAQHQQWESSPAPPSQSIQSPPAAPNHPSIQSPLAIVAPVTTGHGPACPTPPRWVPYWSEQSQQWCYVETSGRSSWQAPSDLPPLAGMPAFPGSLNTQSRGHDGPMTHLSQPQYANPQDSRPSLPEKEKKSSTFLAAAGGFATGGAAGYFVKERIDKRKAKKHGRTVEDFSDFAHFPAWEVDLECNICDQVISGPYAHCKKCDGGDYDICRDCLAQGEVCKGKGKHNLVKVYPKYYCDVCNLLIKGGFYYCSICNNGDWDTCQKCFDAGNTCRGMERGETHNLTHLYMPEPKFGKGSGKYDSSSSSGSD
ncbi:kinesin light chain [Fusarium sp. NRRL 52700]|nr:kinesin light chain [Fusarium sp. NRRL 52700]